MYNKRLMTKFSASGIVEFITARLGRKPEASEPVTTSESDTMTSAGDNTLTITRTRIDNRAYQIGL